MDHPQSEQERVEVKGYYKQCEYCYMYAPIGNLGGYKGAVEVWRENEMTFITPHTEDCPKPRPSKNPVFATVEFNNVPKEVIKLIAGMDV